MRIALVGTRGVPAAYSGFETAVEQIGSRLAARGHDVVVYCRPHMVPRQPGDVYRGMNLVYLPTVAGKHLDTPVHTALSTLHLGAVRRPDVAFYFIAGNSPCAGLGRLLGVPTAINVDGLDSERAKWSWLARLYLRCTERAAPVLAGVAITDSREVQALYRSWGHRTVYIPYGSELEVDDEVDERDRPVAGGMAAAAGGAAGGGGTPAAGGAAAAGGTADGPAAATGGPPADVLVELGLEPRGYVLFVGRLVPENNAHVLVDAFRGLRTDLRLAVVGDAPYAETYQARLRARGDPRIIFAGYRFGAAYRRLLRNAAVVCVPSEVGGTHPVILEAMAAGACLVVNDHAPNVEAVGDAGVSYAGAEGAGGLRRALAEVLADPQRMDSLRAAAAERSRRLYSWEAVTDAYEQLAWDLVARREARRGRHGGPATADPAGPAGPAETGPAGPAGHGVRR